MNVIRWEIDFNVNFNSPAMKAAKNGGYVLASDYYALETLQGETGLSLDTMTAERDILRAALKEFDSFYPELAQLVNGCKQDWQMANSWSEWDESVVIRLRSVAAMIHSALGPERHGSPTTIPIEIKTTGAAVIPPQPKIEEW